MSRVAVTFAGAAVCTLLIAGTTFAEQDASPCSCLSWTVLKHDTPGRMWAHGLCDVTVRLKNTGSQAWSSEQGDRLSYHWLDADGKVVQWDGRRTDLPRTVKPGEEIDLLATIAVLPTIGSWQLEWEMVREGACWYGPPPNQERPRVSVGTVWRASRYVPAFVLIGSLLVLGARFLARARPGLSWWLAALLPLAWASAAIFVLGCVFFELTAIGLWESNGWMLASASLLLTLPVALLPARARRWVALALTGTLATVLLGDLLYLRFFGSIVPIRALAAIGQLGQVQESVRELFRSGDQWLTVPLLGATIFALLGPSPANGVRPPRPQRTHAWLGTAAVCLIPALPAFWSGLAPWRDENLLTRVFSFKLQVERYGVVPVHAVDLVTTMGSVADRHRLDAAARTLIADVYRREPRPEQARQFFGMARGANLILIQAESLQQFIVGGRVNGHEVMPFLSSLRRRALYFPWVFEQTGHGRSSDGEFIALNSQLSNPNGAAAFLNAQDHFVTLAGVLRAHGYETLSAHAFDRGFWNRALLHPRFGFARSLFDQEIGDGPRVGWGLADGVFLTRVLPAITELHRPYFAFLITLGLHHPFDNFPKELESLDVGHLEGNPLGNYIHSMHYLDQSLAQMFDALVKSGELSNTVVAIYGDHESGLNVDDELLNVAGIPGGDPTILYRLRRVPLFVWLPGAQLTGEVSVVGGQVDIAPSLLFILGIDSPASFLGSPLVPGRAAITTIGQRAATDGVRVYAPREPGQWADTPCFLLATGELRTVSECDALGRASERQREAAYLVLEHDLAVEIAEGRLDAESPGR